MIRFLSILLLSVVSLVAQGNRTVMVSTNTGVLNAGTFATGVFPNITQFATDEQDISSQDPRLGRFLISLTQPVSGFWVWDNASTDPSGDGVIEAAGYVTGRWVRQFGGTTAPDLDSSKGVVIDANKRIVASTATKQQIDKTAMNVATIAALKALSTNITSGQVIIVGGYNSNGDGGGGPFWYDGSDTSSSDDGGSVIVSTSGGMRFKRIILGPVTPLMWGALGNETGDDSSEWTSAILYAKRGSTNSALGLRIVDGLGLRYRLTSAIGSLATDGFGVGVSIVNATFVQATANTPTIVARETVRQVQLQWPQAIALVPALTNARVEFNAVFTNLFTSQ